MARYIRETVVRGKSADVIGRCDVIATPRDRLLQSSFAPW